MYDEKKKATTEDLIRLLDRPKRLISVNWITCVLHNEPLHALSIRKHQYKSSQQLLQNPGSTRVNAYHRTRPTRS